MRQDAEQSDRVSWAAATGGPQAPLVAAQRLEALLPAGLVRDDEIILLHLRPSLWFVPLSSLGALTAIAMGALLLALLAVRIPWVPWSEIEAYSLGAAVATARLLWQCLEWWSRIYVLTDRRVIRRSGVLRVAVFEAPLRHIQHTSVFVTLRERLFGLGTIGFATAGSDVFVAFWVMVYQPFAAHRTVVDAIQRYGRP